MSNNISQSSMYFSFTSSQMLNKIEGQLKTKNERQLDSNPVTQISHNRVFNFIIKKSPQKD